MDTTAVDTQRRTDAATELLRQAAIRGLLTRPTGRPPRA